MSRPLRTTSFTEPKVQSDLVKYELDSSYNREAVTVVSGAGVLPFGRVLGRITASGKYTNYTPGATNGSEVASAVLLAASVDASAADKAEVVVLARGPATVALQELTWGAAVTTQGHKDTAIAALKALGILAKALA